MSSAIEKYRELADAYEQAAILTARDRYYNFLKLMFSSAVNPQWNWHHRYVCNVLEDFVLNNDTNRLMIFMPPQHTKSTMMTEYLPAFALGKNPNLQIILAMYNRTLASSYNRRIQKILSNEIYQRIFSQTKLNSKNVVTDAKGAYVRNAEMFEIVGKIGFLKAIGVGGGIAGTPAKLALLDDVIKNVEEAHSPTYRQKVYDWYTDELEARLHNDSKVAFTITRRHEDDLAGRLLNRDGTIEEGGKWKVIKLPAIKEDNSNPNDPRQIGEALFPQLHNLERLEYIQRTSPRTFASLYQQRPAPIDGELIKKNWFDIVLSPPISDIPINAYLDTAHTEKTKNDPTGLLLTRKVNNRLYIIKYFEFRQTISDLIESIRSLEGIYLNKRSKIYIEPKANGKDIVDILKRLGMNCVEYKMISGDKVARTMANEPYYSSGRVALVKGAWNDSFLDKLAAFPNAKHDEAVDVLNMAVTEEIFRGTPQKRQASGFYY